MKPALIDFIDTSNKMLVCRCSADSELCTKSSAKGQGSAFEKVLLINFIDTRNSLPKHCVFVDCLFVESQLQGILLIMFFHNKPLFYNKIG